jgi:hypothetical protein
MWLKIAFLLAIASGCATSTRSVSPSPRLAGDAIEQGDVILRDNFDDPAGGRFPRNTWFPGIDHDYADGEYYIRLAPSFASEGQMVGPDLLFANTEIEVDARLVGDTETRWIGILCRLEVRDGALAGGYALVIRPATGWVSLARVGANSNVRLVPDQISAAVRRGNSTNILELTWAGTTIVARINGTVVASVRDGALQRGRMGLVVGRPEPIRVEGRFDNLVIREASIER